MQILIADDDAVVRRLLEATLARLGHMVTPVDSGSAAWRRYQSTHYPVVITDWIMPDGDGFELCRRIRGATRDTYTYILLLTAYGGRQHLLEALEAGADDFMIKPFDPAVLAARLKVADRILHLQNRMKKLEGLLPVCSYCKRIRNDVGGWEPIERYIAQRSDAEFTHGICPECYDHHIGKLG